MKATIITFSMLGVLAISACKSKPAQNANHAPAVPVVEASTKSIIAYQSYPATIEGKINNAVRAKISGYIKQVFVDEGQPVSKGQALFRLETNVQQQDANAASAAISAAKANISAAKAVVNAAQVEVNKLTPLVEKNIISNVQLETAKANLSKANSQLEQANAGYKQAQAAHNAVTANLDYGVVRSPISGIVGAINFREGSLVGPADPTPITTISQTGEVYAYFSMNERSYLDFLETSSGKTVKEKINNIPEVNLELANGQLFSEKGKIQTVTGQINPQTGTIQFRASFVNKNGLLSNGNSGIIKVPIFYNNVTVVPESATYEQQGLTYVFKVEKDTVINTPIKIIDRTENLAIVASGIKPGDKVVAQGVGKLKPGTAIKSLPTNLDSLIQSIKPIFNN
ncbi:MAG: efflux RND transporter periplasmic adaptor subunit [Chitinophagaceae bacterium]|nr:MAG: efflux RND transporter periplasmic adaptor subunit [Chitinophagaceae bacterium]